MIGEAPMETWLGLSVTLENRRDGNTWITLFSRFHPSNCNVSLMFVLSLFYFFSFSLFFFFVTFSTSFHFFSFLCSLSPRLFISIILTTFLFSSWRHTSEIVMFLWCCYCCFRFFLPLVFFVFISSYFFSLFPFHSSQPVISSPLFVLFSDPSSNVSPALPSSSFTSSVPSFPLPLHPVSSHPRPQPRFNQSQVSCLVYFKDQHVMFFCFVFRLRCLVCRWGLNVKEVPGSGHDHSRKRCRWNSISSNVVVVSWYSHQVLYSLLYFQ